MKTCSVIIAGGRSARMGSEKLLLTVGGRSIFDRQLAILPVPVAINANGDLSRFSGLSIPVIPDEPGRPPTPLTGLHAALRWASSAHDAVLTVPSDCPFLPDDLHFRLASGALPAVAASGGQTHFITGLWPVNLLPLIEDAMDKGLMRVMDWVALSSASIVTWPSEPYDPFMNVNTPEELSIAEKVARSSI
jgi:molybdopterin-guanine dinucleotide biosynthesis protein A